MSGDSIYLVGEGGRLTEARSAAHDAEADLQRLLAENLHLLPGAQISQESPRRWQLVKREAGVPEHEGGGAWWSVDHLAVDQDAVPTFIEVKRSSDTRGRREVVAQMLDYAANGSLFWTPELLRGWYEDNDRAGANERLAGWLGTEEDPDAAAELFWQAVGMNLREGRVRLIFVADEIPASLQRLVEFLNEQMPRIEVLAVEIRQYRSGDSRGPAAVVPRLIGQTARAQAAKEPAAPVARRSSQWSADEVTEIITRFSEHAGRMAVQIIGWAHRQEHLRIEGGRGTAYPSVMLAADTGQGWRGVLGLYGSLRGERPMLEIRAGQMCQTPPYDQADNRAELLAGLRRLGLERVDALADLESRRPNVFLDDLTSEQLDGLLAVAGQWITGVSRTPK